jgi:leader peptidase (prepilin peptidase)/N-methyltransferase
VAIASAVVGLFVAFILGAVVGVILIARRKAGRGSRVPFGPFLLMGAAVGLLVGESLGTAYLDMVGL